MKITVIRDGKENVYTATVGDRLMDVIPNFFGDCGGNAVCGTCHVQVLSNHEIEITEMAKFALDLNEEVEYNSRLSCQIVLEEKHDGLKIKVID